MTAHACCTSLLSLSGLFMGKYIFPGADASCPLRSVHSRQLEKGVSVGVMVGWLAVMSISDLLEIRFYSPNIMLTISQIRF